MKNVRLFGCFTLRSPLSHISEAIGTTSYLVQEPVRQDDSTFAEVFCYSGNAWRGQLRDLAAAYMLEKLGNPSLPVDSFHLLFSGGRIGGDQNIDLRQARAWRRAIPIVALFGGGVGNQILPGRMRVSNSYPLCKEAAAILPASMRAEAKLVEYASLTFEKSFSRKDDSKNPDLGEYIAAPNSQIEDKRPRKKKESTADDDAGDRDDEAATQMRMTVELVAAGAKLYSEIDVLGASEVELGALVSALHLFSRSPFIGGQSNRGHGRVELDYQIMDLDSGETQKFLAIADGPAKLAPPAASAKQAYDSYLREQYDRMLAANGAPIMALLGASENKPE